MQISQKVNTEDKEGEGEVLTFKGALLSKTTIHIWAMLLFSASYVLYVSNVFKSYGSDSFSNDRFLTTVGSCGAILNGISRPVWTIFQDKLGFKSVYGFMIMIQIPLAAYFPMSIHSEISFFFAVCLSLTCLGGHFSMFPTVCVKVYGPKIGPQVYGFIFSAFSVGTVLTTTVQKHYQQTWGYSNIFLMLSAMSAVSLALCFLFDETPQHEFKKVKQI